MGTLHLVVPTDIMIMIRLKFQVRNKNKMIKNNPGIFKLSQLLFILF